MPNLEICGYVSRFLAMFHHRHHLMHEHGMVSEQMTPSISSLRLPVGSDRIPTRMDAWLMHASSILGDVWRFVSVGTNGLQPLVCMASSAFRHGSPSGAGSAVMLSHCRGHWFDPSIAHSSVCFVVGDPSLETSLRLGRSNATEADPRITQEPRSLRRHRAGQRLNALGD
jgi:hypothetical protein